MKGKFVEKFIKFQAALMPWSVFNKHNISIVILSFMTLALTSCGSSDNPGATRPFVNEVVSGEENAPILDSERNLEKSGHLFVSLSIDELFWRQVPQATSKIEVVNEDTEESVEITVPLAYLADSWRVDFGFVYPGNYTLAATFSRIDGVNINGTDIAYIETPIQITQGEEEESSIYFGIDSALIIIPPQRLADTDGNGLLEIIDMAQFEDVRANPNGNYELTRDFDLTEYLNYKTPIDSMDYRLGRSLGKWQPIGKDEFTPFTGIFEGNGYTISGISVEGFEYVGFFGYVRGATISNTNFNIASIGGNSYVGGLAGVATTNSRINNVNVTITGDLSGTALSDEDDLFIGGLLGNGDDIFMVDSYATIEGDIYASGGASSRVGGLAGNIYRSIIQNPNVRITGDILLSATESVSLGGGLAGMSEQNQIINPQITVDGKISSFPVLESVNNFAGSFKLGGMAGIVDDTDIKNITIEVDNGILAQSAGHSYLGGLAGDMDGTDIQDARIFINQSIGAELLDGGGWVGGMAGSARNGLVNNTVMEINNLTVTSSAQANNYGGGLFGFARQVNMASIVLSIEDIDVSTINHNAFAAGLIGVSEDNNINQAYILVNTITASAPSSESYSSGLIAVSEDDEITNVFLSAASTINVVGWATSSATGGIGSFVRGSLSSSYFLMGGNIHSLSMGSANELTNTYASGVVGFCSFCEMSNIYVEAERNISASATGTVSVGGIIGAASSASVITNSYAVIRGDISAPYPHSYTGGLAGWILNGELAASGVYYLANRATSQNSGIFESSAGEARSLQQLSCPTAPNASCELQGNGVTYSDWDESIWDFGMADDLPELRVFQGIF